MEGIKVRLLLGYQSNILDIQVNLITLPGGHYDGSPIPPVDNFLNIYHTKNITEHKRCII